MDIIFDAGKEDIQFMIKAIEDFIKNNNVTISNSVPTIIIYEGRDYDCKLLEMYAIKGVAEYIYSILNEGKMYKRCLVLFGLHYGMMYLMFTDNLDTELPKVISMATVGWC